MLLKGKDWLLLGPVLLLLEMMLRKSKVPNQLPQMKNKIQVRNKRKLNKAEKMIMQKRPKKNKKRRKKKRSRL